MNDGGGLPVGAGGDTPVGEPIAQCPLTPTSLTVTVRRDFPRREGEVLGDWQWSQPDGTQINEPIHWTAPFTAIRSIFGWGIGNPALGSPGGRGGLFTTDDSGQNAGPIAATVSLVRGETVIASATTSGPDGECQLDTTGQDGEVFVDIVPDARDETPRLPIYSVMTAIAPDARDVTPTGPELPSIANPPRIIYRKCRIRIRLRCGLMEEVYDPYDPHHGKTHSRVGNRKKFEPEPDHLPVSLKPVWWQHPGILNRPSGQTVGLIVIHRTSGTRLGNAFNSWFASQSHTGPHYSIDVDGHVIKHVREEDKIEHAGGHWEGSGNINDRSIGIEIINPNATGWSQYPDYATTGDPDYTYEQYRALIELLDRITVHLPDIGHRIVGHADVATGPPPAGTPNDMYGTKRNWDPGTFFEWERIEAEGLGMIPAEPSAFNATTHYDGVFDAFPDVVLRQDDRDPGPSGRPSARYGGSDRPGFAGQPIRLLQQDLKDIGYSIRVNGQFDDYTKGAVDRFNRHFFSGTRGQLTGGTVDAEIARRIKDVAEAIRSP